MKLALRTCWGLASSVATVLALALYAAPGVATPDRQREEVARIVAKQTGGRVLSVEPAVGRFGMWRVKVLASSGDLFVIEVRPPQPERREVR